MLLFFPRCLLQAEPSETKKCRTYLFEGDTNCLPVKLDVRECDFLWLLQGPGGHQFLARGLAVLLEVIGASVGDSDTLHPAEAGFDFRVPAVAGVVSHFVFPVLPKSDVVFVDAHLDQEIKSSGHEVGHRLVADKSLVDGILDLHHHRSLLLFLLLPLAAQQGNASVFDKFVLGVLSEHRVKEMLDFGHVEFSQSEKLVSGRNLISEAEADLRCGKGHPSTVKGQELAEIHKHTLGRLGSQISNLVAKWT